MVRQQDQSDCGVACLASIIGFYGGEYNLENLRRSSGTSASGTTLLGLLQAAAKSGLNAEGLQATDVSDLRDIDKPAILHVTVDNGYQHFVVYFPDKGQQNKLELFDPAKGVTRITEIELKQIWLSKALLTLEPNENFEKRSGLKAKKKKWILELIDKDLNVLFVALLLGVVISILTLSTAIFSQRLIDDILPKENIQKLVLSLVAVALILLIRNAISYLRGTLMIEQGRSFNNRIIENFYSNILQLNKTFFDSRRTGDMIARMNDTRRIQQVLATLFGSVVIDILILAISLIVVFAYSTSIGALVITTVPIYFVILRLFNTRILRTQREVMQGYASTESNFVDTVQGVIDIKLSNKQRFFEKMNAAIYNTFQQKIVDLGRLNVQLGIVSDSMAVVVMITVFAMASVAVISKEITLGGMVAMTGVIGNVLPSINRLVIANIQVQEAIVVFDRMFEFTSVEKEPEGPHHDPIPINELVLSNVSFRFPGRDLILKNVSFSLRRGEITALLGESGGGKSTLVQILQKFYTPESGSIRVGDRDLGLVNTAFWREHIASVPQESKIFNGNLLYNITLSDSPEDFKSAIAFCNEKGFSTYFKTFPQGFLTKLGEEGVNISGGQKQLVVLARALYRRPKILFLDEATSAMDRNAENFVLSMLANEKINMAVLMITHRLRVASRCDHIVVLEAGCTLQPDQGGPEVIHPTSFDIES